MQSQITRFDPLYKRKRQNRRNRLHKLGPSGLSLTSGMTYTDCLSLSARKWNSYHLGPIQTRCEHGSYNPVQQHSTAFVGSRTRGRSGIRPGRECAVWRVEERASLVKSTQTYICRTAVRTRSLIRLRFTRWTPDTAREHDHQAGRHLAPLGVSARRFQAAGSKHRVSSPGVRSRING